MPSMENQQPDPDIRYFKGNQFKTMVGWLVWVFSLVMPVMFLCFGLWELALGAFVFFFLLFFLMLSTTLNYFGVSPYFIEVRNHNLPWIRKQFYFEDVSRVAIEKRGKNDCLTVHFKTGKSKQYSGLSLTDELWLSLKQELNSRGVEVTDKIRIEERMDPLNKKYSRKIFWRLGVMAVCTMPLSYYVVSWKPDTGGGIFLKLLLVLGLLALTIFAMRKILAYTTAQYNEEKERGKVL